MKLALIIAAACLLGVVAFFLLRKPKLVDKSFATYGGRVADYKGKKKLVVAFTVTWASFWVVTASELKKLDTQKFDLCILDATVDQSEIRSFGITFFPTVALVEDGKILKSVQNLNSIELLKGW